MRAINSSQLGTKGESRFEELCADGGLICNPPKKDLAGWDFTVNFPMKVGKIDTLDQRPSPLSCYVQVKTMWSTNRRFRLRLSSAERLVKEPKPTFIYVFQVADDLTFSKAYLIHVHGDFLADVLHRLRMAERDGVTAVNRQYFSVDVARWGVPIEIAGQDLVAAIERDCPALPAYIEAKAQFLKEVGYSNNRIRFDTTVVAANLDALVDAFLGSSELEASRIAAYESRFGIELPLHDPEVGLKGGKLRIEPNPASKACVRVRSGILKPAVFRGDLFAPGIPNLPDENIRVVVKTPAFDFTFRKGSVSFVLNINWEQRPKFRLEEWLNFFHALKLLQQGQASIELSAPGMPPLVGSLELDRPSPFTARAARSYELVEKAADILDLAGVDGSEIAFQDLVQCEDAILAAHERLTKAHDHDYIYRYRLERPKTEVGSMPSNFKARFLNPLPISEYCIAYVTDLTLERCDEGELAVWTATSCTTKSIHVLTDYEDDYQRLIAIEEKAAPEGNFGFWPVVEADAEAA